MSAPSRYQRADAPRYAPSADDRKAVDSMSDYYADAIARSHVEATGWPWTPSPVPGEYNGYPTS